MYIRISLKKKLKKKMCSIYKMFSFIYKCYKVSINVYTIVGYIYVIHNSYNTCQDGFIIINDIYKYITYKHVNNKCIPYNRI